MTTVVKTPHLQKRGARYYFRRRVPAHVRSHIPNLEWVESLETGDLTIARRKARALSVETDRLIAQAEMAQPLATLDQREARRIAQEWLVQQIALDEEGRRRRGTLFYREQTAHVTENKDGFAMAYARGRVAETNALALKLLEERNFRHVAEDSVRELSWELLGARLKLIEIIEQRNAGRWVITPPTNLPEPAAPLNEAVRAQALATTRTVAELVLAYSEHQADKHGSAWVEKRYRHIFRALEELLGPQTPVNELTRQKGRDLVQFLRQVPQHAGKRFPGLTLTETIAASSGADIPKLSDTTIATYVSNLSAMMNWAVREGWSLANPIEKQNRKATPTVRRRPFTTDELKRIFDALLDFKSEEPWKYWLPALALYTGARAGELCQMQRGDVILDGSEASIRISIYDRAGRRVGWKNLKTPASERIIPVHPALISAELIEFASGAPDERLFPSLPEGANGGFSHGLTRWFARFLAGLGMNDPSLVFHSFRHGFKDACLRGGAADSTVRALGGWSLVDVADHYGSSVPAILRKAINDLDYDDFSIS